MIKQLVNTSCHPTLSTTLSACTSVRVPVVYITLRRFQIQHRLRIQNRLFYEFIVVYESIKSRGREK